MVNRQAYFGRRSEPDQRRDLTVREISLRADSIDEKTRSVEATIVSEAMVTVFDMRQWEPIDEVLRMDGFEAPDQVPLLASHDRFSLDSIYGSARQIAKRGDHATARLFFAEGDEASERAWNKVKQKHIRDVSAGYRVVEYTDIEPRQSAVVKGVTYTAGVRRLRIVTRWELREVSIVPIGADQRAKIRGEQPQGNPMNPKLRAYLQTIGLRAEATDAEAQDFYNQLDAGRRAAADAAAAEVGAGNPTPPPLPGNGQRSGDPGQLPNPPPQLVQTPLGQMERSAWENLRSSILGENTPAPGLPATGAPEAIRQQALNDERERIRQINELAGTDVPAEMVQRAVTEGWDVSRASREFLTAVRSLRGNPAGQGAAGPAIHSRSHEADCNVRSLATGLMLSLGLRGEFILQQQMRAGNGRREGARFSEQELELGERFSRLNAIDICRECARIDGRGHILDYEDAVRAAMSGATFNHVFSTNVYAKLNEGWQKIGDTTMGWCDEEDVPNFMEQEDISLEANASLEQLPRGGTAKDATASDSHETYRIARYAKKFVLDEQDFIDDRLGAIMRMPMDMGKAARRLRPDMVYATMLANPNLVADGAAVFNATSQATAGGHGNLGTAALSQASLKAAISAMVKQRINRTADDPGEALTLRPRYLIVTADLEWTARALTATAALAKLFADSSDPFYSTLNLIAQEGITVVVDDRIGSIGVKDPRTKTVRTGVDTNWFLTSGPDRGLRVAYRRGTNRQPQMRSFQLDRGQWGMGWDINMDIGVAFMDYRTWYKSTGATE